MIAEYGMYGMTEGVIRNDVNYEMINSHTLLRDKGFTLDLNFFYIDEELHGNLQLNASNLEPNQDIYLGFIFRHAEALDQASTESLDDEILDEPTANPE